MAEATPTKTVKMELKRHYVPHNLISIVGYENKIWAKTVIEVPEDEAKVMRQKGIAEAYL